MREIDVLPADQIMTGEELSPQKTVDLRFFFDPLRYHSSEPGKKMHEAEEHHHSRDVLQG